jgi:transcriptional regulator GlxA family with amidase domain
MTLSIISSSIGPVSTRPPPHAMEDGMVMDMSFMLGFATTATHTFENAPNLNVIIVPGGLGNLALIQRNDTSIEKFLAERYESTDYILSVCTGAVNLARAGILDNRKATTNKVAWHSVVKYGTNTTWVPSARWVVDGKVWTSSGVAAGMDMTYAFLKHLYGPDTVNPAMDRVEYAPHTDPQWDPFSIVHNVRSTTPPKSVPLII